MARPIIKGLKVIEAAETLLANGRELNADLIKDVQKKAKVSHTYAFNVLHGHYKKGWVTKESRVLVFFKKFKKINPRKDFLLNPDQIHYVKDKTGVSYTGTRKAFERFIEQGVKV